ncbi:protein-export chaperone SecB [Chryseobacterium indologenes]|uniref:protein-export chaperone SecB n=1 Tax=Chryseobacterium indologenes TaxID=253 RepID=UPI003D34BD87
MENNMQLQYLGLQVREAKFKVKSYEKSVADSLETELKIKSGFSDDDKRRFAIIIHLTLKSDDSNFFLQVEAHNHFAINQDMPEGFEQSPFVNVNAPAIAFPYIRAFISNLTLNAGYDPVILPSYNFVKLYQDKSK